MARPFSHPNLGHQARVELDGNEVKLIFVCGSYEKASGLADDLVKQLANGALNITIMGEVESIKDSWKQ